MALTDKKWGELTDAQKARFGSKRDFNAKKAKRSAKAMSKNNLDVEESFKQSPSKPSNKANKPTPAKPKNSSKAAPPASQSPKKNNKSSYFSETKGKPAPAPSPAPPPPTRNTSNATSALKEAREEKAQTIKGSKEAKEAKKATKTARDAQIDKEKVKEMINVYGAQKANEMIKKENIKDGAQKFLNKELDKLGSTERTPVTDPDTAPTPAPPAPTPTAPTPAPDSSGGVLDAPPARTPEPSPTMTRGGGMMGDDDYYSTPQPTPAPPPPAQQQPAPAAPTPTPKTNPDVTQPYVSDSNNTVVNDNSYIDNRRDNSSNNTNRIKGDVSGSFIGGNSDRSSTYNGGTRGGTYSQQYTPMSTQGFNPYSFGSYGGYGANTSNSNNTNFTDNSYTDNRRDNSSNNTNTIKGNIFGNFVGGNVDQSLTINDRGNGNGMAASTANFKQMSQLGHSRRNQNFNPLGSSLANHYGAMQSRGQGNGIGTELNGMNQKTREAINGLRDRGLYRTDRFYGATDHQNFGSGYAPNYERPESVVFDKLYGDKLNEKEEDKDK